MCALSKELLLLDQRQALIAPTVLSELRQSSISAETYFRLLAEDAALGLPLTEWAERLASNGILSVAHQCWMACGLAQEEVHRKYQAAKSSWDKKIDNSIAACQKLLDETRKQIPRDTQGQIESFLREARQQADQDWHDLGFKLIDRARTILEESLLSLMEERKKTHTYLSGLAEDIQRRLASLAATEPSSEGHIAVNYLLQSVTSELNNPAWNPRRVNKLLKLSQELCDGGTIDHSLLARELGAEYGEFKREAYPAPQTPSDFASITAIGLEAEEEGSKIDSQQRHRQERSEQLHRKSHTRRIEGRIGEFESLLRQALQLWPGNESATKNLASLLRQHGKTREAVDVLEHGLEYALEPLPFYNLLTGYYIDLNEFNKAREYAQKALKLCGDPGAEIGVLSALVTLEVKEGNLGRAVDYCDAILRINPKHEHFRKKRERLESALSGQISISKSDSISELDEVALESVIEISPLLQEDIDRCELTKVLPGILQSARINRKFAEAERLHESGLACDPKQHKEKAEYFLQAAKLLLENRIGNELTGSIATKLEKHLNNYTGVMGDYLLARQNMDSARDYYLEHVRLYKRMLPWYTLRRIANYFQTFIPYNPELLKIPTQKSAAPRVIGYVISQTIKAADKSVHNELARGVLEIASLSEPVSRDVVRAIRSDDLIRQQLQSLLDPFVKKTSLETVGADFSETFLQFVAKRRLLIERQENELRYLSNIMGDRLRLVEAEAVLHRLMLFQSGWSSSDRVLFSRVLDLARETTRYFEESRYEDKEILAVSIAHSADKFLSLLNDGPTYLGRAYFSRIVYRLRRLIEEEHRNVRLVSLPDLVPSVVKAAWLEPHAVRECHIQILNKGESAAQEVNVRILESETDDYMTDHRPYPVPGSSIYARPHSATVALPVTLRDKAVLNDAIDLRLLIEYYDRENRKKESAPIRLRLPLHDEVSYTPIENPYHTGLPVLNKDMFVGRKLFLQEIIHQLTRPERTSAVVIYGQKRSGKTSILRHVELGAPDWVLPVYFSMQTVLLEEGAIVPSMFYLIADEISRKAHEMGVGDKVGTLSWEALTAPPGLSLQFRMFLDRIRKLPNIRLVLLVDEFTELAARIDEGQIDSSIMKYLKSLIEQGFFSCVLCGIDSMPQVLNQYSNELAVSDPRFVGYLQPEAAAELIERPIPLPDNRSRFTSKQVVEEIITLTAGSPYYIQFVCHRLVEYLNRTSTPTVTGADMDRVVAELIQGPKRLDPLTKFDNLSRYKEDATRDTRETTLEGLFLYLLANETRTRKYAPFSIFKQRAPFVEEDELLTIANILEDKQVIERASGQVRQYRIVVDLFRRWININRIMDSETLAAFRRRIERMSA